MTRILVQRGGSASNAGSSSSNPNRNSNASLPGSSSARPEPQAQPAPVKDEEIRDEVQEQVVVEELLEFCGSSDDKTAKSDDLSMERESLFNDQNEGLSDESADSEKTGSDEGMGLGELTKGMGGLRISERLAVETEGSSGDSSATVCGSSHPPPPPVPPPKPSSGNSTSRRCVPGNSNANAMRIGSSRRAVAWPVVSTRTSPTGSRPSSPRSHGESEGYNSSDEQNPCYVSSYDDNVS